ncbi:MAG TPA: hypothetical protein VF432_09155 [Thermoanaerobaculia bacterium]
MWEIFDRFRTKPWQGRPTIYSAVKAWDGSSDLPDEEPEQGGLRFSAGALDNVGVRHFGLDGEPQMSRLFRALERVVTHGRDADRTTLYRLMLQYDAVVHAGALSARVQASSLDREAVAEVARWLATEAADREPVKYGLILLALCGSPRDLDLVMTYARHDEFTMHAVTALERVAEDVLAAELAMAEQVRGWGKVSLVERIVEHGSDRADVRDWLLRRGFANAVMDEYLAYACAVAGRLHEALAADTIDAELRQGACAIVHALINGGPAEDMDDYDHGPAAVGHLLRHLARTTEPRELMVVAAISSWLASDRDWSAAEARGWSADVRADIASKTHAILRRDEVATRLRDAFRGDDRMERFAAWEAAGEAEVDLWEDAFALAQAEPETYYLYQWLSRTKDPMRLRRTITLAEQSLPLEEIASGPAEEMFGGDADMALTFVLQALPGSGQFSGPLVKAALRSPLVNVRYRATRVLESTTRPEWGSDVVATLLRAAAEEPDEDVKSALEELLPRI